MASNLFPFPVMDGRQLPYSLQEWFRQLRDRLNSSFTNVSFTGGLISVTSVALTEALTVAGTSGGIVYFSSASTWASSGALGANKLVIGGGAGVAPSTLGSFGTTTTVLHGNAAGAPTFGAVSLTADISGILPVANGGTGASSLGAALTKTDDTNVTLTLAGTPATALLVATSLTLGWTGQLSVARGGTGISSFGTGIATWLGTPSSANLLAAITDETGTGALVFANTPTLISPILGTPTSGILTNCTGTASGLTAGDSSKLLGSTWASPAAIGTGTPLAITGTTITSTVVVQLPSYTVAGVPSASPAGQLIYVSNAGGNGPCMAVSNGSNWKRCDNTSTTVAT